jgi:chaperonin cofactor prefoldin
MAKVAVAWLLEKDWPRWQELDSQLSDFSRWLSKIESAIKEVERTSAATEKIEVDPETFVTWCKANGKAVGRDSRSQYAAQILMNRLTAH